MNDLTIIKNILANFKCRPLHSGLDVVIDQLDDDLSSAFGFSMSRDFIEAVLKTNWTLQCELMDCYGDTQTNDCVVDYFSLLLVQMPFPRYIDCYILEYVGFYKSAYDNYLEISKQ